MKIPGKDFVISIEINGQQVPICHATDCIIDKTYETVETSGTTTYWKDYIGGYAGYTIQIPALVVYTEEVNIVQLEAWADARQKLTWFASSFDNGGIVYTGTILITNLNKSSQMRDVMKFEVNAVGCGPMETRQLPVSSEVYLADFNKARLAGCPNPYPVSVYWYDENGDPGVFIGIAANADEVLVAFNEYPENTKYELTGYTSGCDFSLLSDWDAPFFPTVIYAQPLPDMVLWDGNDDNAISPNQDDDQVISPGYA